MRQFVKQLAVVLSAMVAFGAQAAKGPAVKGHTASEQAFRVSSYAIVSDGEIALVDSQMMLDEADKFIELVKKEQGTVKTIFITHAHPDHFLGLSRVKAAFPEAKIVAAPDTAEAINAGGGQMLAFYREQFMNGALAQNLATEIPQVEALEGETLKVGSSEWKLLTFDNVEAKVAHGLWNEKTKELISGDLVYNNVHLWLADKDGEPTRWHSALEQLGKLKPKKIYPGHGKPGGKELLKKDMEYLQFFVTAAKTSHSGDELKEKVFKKFPKLEVKPIVEYSAGKYFPAKPAAAAPDAGTAGGPDAGAAAP